MAETSRMKLLIGLVLLGLALFECAAPLLAEQSRAIRATGAIPYPRTQSIQDRLGFRT
jgi:hypothetical protein